MNAKRKQDIDHDFYDGFTVMTMKEDDLGEYHPVEQVVLYREECSKCNGKGFIGQYVFRENGKCYQCDGRGYRDFKQPADIRAKNRARAAESKAKRQQRDFEAFEAEHPVIAAWWTGSTYPFAVSLREGCMKYGSLTEGQMIAAYKVANKFASAKAGQQSEAVDISGLEKAFVTALRNGLQRVKLRLLGDGIPLLFQPANEHAKPENQGAIYIKDERDDTYLGKIKDGKFYRSRACNDEQYAAVIAACKAPEESAIAFGKRFGQCSCCGRTLTNSLSIELGIGPICRGKFFG